MATSNELQAVMVELDRSMQILRTNGVLCESDNQEYSALSLEVMGVQSQIMMASGGPYARNNYPPGSRPPPPSPMLYAALMAKQKLYANIRDFQKRLHNSLEERLRARAEQEAERERAITQTIQANPTQTYQGYRRWASGVPAPPAPRSCDHRRSYKRPGSDEDKQ